MIRQNAFFGYVPGGQRKREYLQSTSVKKGGKGSGTCFCRFGGEIHKQPATHGFRCGTAKKQKAAAVAGGDGGGGRNAALIRTFFSVIMY